MSDLPTLPPAPPSVQPTVSTAAFAWSQLSTAQLLLWAVALAALGLGSYGYLTRAQLAERVAQDAARAMSQSQLLAQQAQQSSRIAQDLVRDALGKLQSLETRLAESQNQQLALEKLYEDLSRSKDEWVLIEVERTVELAAQQLQVAGNVNGAIAALQTADTRLARADKPQYASIRKVISRDIERLRAMPAADITGLALKLSALNEQVEELPLVSEPIPLENRPSPSALRVFENRSWYERIWADIKSELGGLVRIRKFQSDQTLLLSPEQGRVVRDTLKLQLLQARLALLARNQRLLAKDLAGIELSLKQHFDEKSPVTRAFLSTLKQIAAAPVVLEYPTLTDTLSAIAAASSTAFAKPLR